MKTLAIVVMGLVSIGAIGGCGVHEYRPSTAYPLAEQVDGWSAERSTWMFEHCRLRGVSQPDVITPRAVPFASHVTNALAFNDDHILFLCPEPTPWPRDDSASVAKWLPTVSSRFTCSAPTEMPAVTVTVPGTGPAVGSGTFLRVRARLVAMTLAKDTLIYHGRPGNGYGAASGAVMLAGATLPVDELAVVYTQHKSCFGCLSKALTQLHVGSHADVACKDESWQVELLAVGGEDLFTSDLRLTRSAAER